MGNVVEVYCSRSNDEKVVSVIEVDVSGVVRGFERLSCVVLEVFDIDCLVGCV